MPSRKSFVRMRNAARELLNERFGTVQVPNDIEGPSIGPFCFTPIDYIDHTVSSLLCDEIRDCIPPFRVCDETEVDYSLFGSFAPLVESIVDSVKRDDDVVGSDHSSDTERSIFSAVSSQTVTLGRQHDFPTTEELRVSSLVEEYVANQGRVPSDAAPPPVYTIDGVPTPAHDFSSQEQNSPAPYYEEPASVREAVTGWNSSIVEGFAHPSTLSWEYVTFKKGIHPENPDHLHPDVRETWWKVNGKCIAKLHTRDPEPPGYFRSWSDIVGLGMGYYNVVVALPGRPKLSAPDVGPVNLFEASLR